MIDELLKHLTLSGLVVLSIERISDGYAIYTESLVSNWRCGAAYTGTLEECLAKHKEHIDDEDDTSRVRRGTTLRSGDAGSSPAPRTVPAPDPEAGAEGVHAGEVRPVAS